MQIDLRVAQLLCSRICHDLIGPAGALQAGVELLGDGDGDGDDRAATLDLLAASARRLTAQLAFFRTAFGLPGGADAALGLAEAGRLARGLFAGGKVSLDWPEAEDAPALPAAITRLLLCVVLLAAGALPRGGRVRCEWAHRPSAADGASPALFAVQADGPGARIDDAALAALTGAAGADALSARTADAYLAARLAEASRAILTVEGAHNGAPSIVVSVPAGNPERQHEAVTNFRY